VNDPPITRAAFFSTGALAGAKRFLEKAAGGNILAGISFVPHCMFNGRKSRECLMKLQPCQARRFLHQLTISSLLLIALVACAGGNPERRPYLISETMDRAEKHRQAGELLEAAEMYHTVLLADPLNQIALNHLRELGSAGSAVTLPNSLGINQTRARSAPSLGWAIGLYPLNRVLDLLDIMTVHVGLEGGGLVDVHATRAMQAGFGGGGGLQFGWWQKRNLALGFGHLGEVALGPVAYAHEGYARAGTGNVTITSFALNGANRPTELAFQRNFDYYGIGCRFVALLVGAEFELHPLELADALGGFLLIDFLHDDPGQTVSPRLLDADRAAMDSLIQTLSEKELNKNLQAIERIANAPATENPEGTPASVMAGRNASPARN
jgi:hypothetical protein